MSLQGALVISLDFELHWGVRDKRSVAGYRENLLGARRAVPAMLAMFRDHGVRATWAVVGLLLAENRDEMLARMPARRPRYRRADLSPYDALAEVGENERDDPYHFASSLVRRIAASSEQEIATHTFGHYYCLEDGAGPASDRASRAGSRRGGARRSPTSRVSRTAGTSRASRARRAARRGGSRDSSGCSACRARPSGARSRGR